MLSAKTPNKAPERLLGICANAGAGKDTVATIFEDFGFTHISLSDILREVIRAQGQKPNRERQTRVANTMRNLHGGDYWLCEGIKRAGDVKNIVLSGIYAPSEGEALKAMGGQLIALTVGPNDDKATRYERIAKRADGTRDDISYQDFEEAHHRENGGQTPSQTNIAALILSADFIIDTSAGIEATTTDVMRIIASTGVVTRD